MKRIVAVWLAIMFTVSCSSQAEMLRDANTLSLFGNWRIEIERSNKSLLLIGVVSEGGGAFVFLQCYATVDWYWLLVPLFDRLEQSKVQGKKVTRLTVWNDNSDAETIALPAMDGKAAFGQADKLLLAKSDPIAIATFAFLGKLTSAKLFFALDAGGPTRTYDVRHFPAAFGQFQKKCAEIRTDWESFVEGLESGKP